MPAPAAATPAPNGRASFVRIARGFAVLAVAAYGFGALGKLGWALDLFAHFRVQYSYLLLACALALFVLRDIKFGLAAGAAATWLAWPVVLNDLPPNAAASVGARAEPRFKVVSLNAWYRNPDTARIARYLAASGADVILVQELDAIRVRELSAALPSYPHTALSAAQDRHGAAILSRWPIAASQPLQLADAKQHAQWALVRWHSRPVQVVSVHLPWPLGARVSAQRNAQLHALARWMGQAAGPLVVGGDFNLSRWSQHFAAALSVAAAQDSMESDRRSGTWPTFFPPLGIRIDHCWVSPDWQVTRAARGPYVGSDHYPIEIELRL